MNYIKNCFWFYFKPSKEYNGSFSIKEKLKGCIFLLIATFILLLAFEVIVPVIFVSSGIIDNWPRIKNPSVDRNFITFCTIAFLIPVIEELVGRLWIIYSKINLSLSVSLASGIAVYKLFGSNNELPWYENYSWLSISVMISIITFTIFLYILRLQNQELLDNFWTTNKRKIILLSAIIFSLLHYRHYDLNFGVAFIVPLLFAFYFFSGLILGYARIRYGFL